MIIDNSGELKPTNLTVAGGATEELDFLNPMLMFAGKRDNFKAIK